MGLDRIKEEGSLLLTLPIYLLATVLGLMPLNLWLEWRKYQLALLGLDIKTSTLRKAFARGLTWRFILPNKMGLAASVVLSSPSKSKLDVAWRLTLANSTQLLVTIVFGFISFFTLQDRVAHTLQIQNTWLWMLGLVGLLVVYLVFRKQVSKQWRTLRNTPAELVRQLFSLSILRYGIFLLQLALAVSVLNPEITILQSLQTVPLIYLYASLIPLGFLGSIGARESIAVAVFTLAMGGAEGVVAASVLVWAVNLLFPALIGLAGHATTLTRSKTSW